MSQSASIALKIFQALDLVGDPGIRDRNNPPQRNAPSPLWAFIAFIRSRLGRGRRLAEDEQAAAAFHRDVDATLSALLEWVAEVRWRDIDAGSEQWLDSGLTVADGDEFTILAQGRLYLNRALDISVGPEAALWYRINGSAVSKLPAASAVIRAAQSGGVQLMPRLPGGFADPHGKLSGDLPTPAVSGRFQVALIRWRGSAREALQRAEALAPEIFGPALESLRPRPQPPEGWQYLWRLGEPAIYRQHPEDGSLCCHTQADVGILQYPVDLPLSDGLRLYWSWLTEALPSRIAEHIQPTHDYLSLAVEFDNGLDLTYMWSSALARDTIFQCPLPWWDQRETHWVVRSDPSELGRWLNERRCLRADYEKAIGGKLPGRVVGVWLIANSLFQRGEGRCRYRGIRFRDGSRETIVYG